MGNCIEFEARLLAVGDYGLDRSTVLALQVAQQGQSLFDFVEPARVELDRFAVQP